MNSNFSYGYLTHTNVKLLLMLQLNDPPLQDEEVLSLFGAIQQAYVEYISNPFVLLQPGELPGSHAHEAYIPSGLPSNADQDSRAITSKRFEKQISAIALWSPEENV